jgi:hypothetical protein
LKIGTVDEMRRRMTCREFETWKVFHAIRNQQIELAKMRQAGG